MTYRIIMRSRQLFLYKCNCPRLFVTLLVLMVLVLLLRRKHTKRTESGEMHVSYSTLLRQMKSSSRFLPKHLSMFKLGMSEKDFHLSLDLLSVFSRVMDRHNLTYFLYAGSLFGAIRHHGPIPWDDDVDVMVSWKEKEKMTQALERLKPDYTLYWSEVRQHWKFYSIKSHKSLNNIPWKYPFLDVFPYKEKGERLLDWSASSQIYFTTKYVFPLQKRRFADLELNCPCNPRALYESRINLTECISPSYNHKYDFHISSSHTVTCQELENYFPFVHQTQSDTKGNTVETLLFKGKLIGKQVIKTLC